MIHHIPLLIGALIVSQLLDGEQAGRYTFQSPSYRGTHCFAFFTTRYVPDAGFQSPSYRGTHCF